MNDHIEHVRVIGGGLAGVEAAFQCLRKGIKVTIHEMRPLKRTGAHQTGDLAELVCSNSFKSMAENSASGLLKAEMKELGSLVVEKALQARVPAGQALSVDRAKFSASILAELESFAKFQLKRDEIVKIPSEAALIESGEAWIIATGPLSSEPIAAEVLRYCEPGTNQQLYFYDAIAPIIDAETIDFSKGYWANRWDDADQKGDYFNIPLSKQQYLDFVRDIQAAEKVDPHEFEDPQYFESCLPIEVMVDRGVDTLRFGPLKPIGLNEPQSNTRPWAVIQLRQENEQGTMMSMVGCQTRMKWPDQKRVFATLPPLANAEFFRLGSIHRNTYINCPKVLDQSWAMKRNSRVYLAGQITGVEGYTESAAIGLLMGQRVAAVAKGLALTPPPESSMIGSLLSYILKGLKGNYQPMNANFGLLPELPRTKGVSKSDNKQLKCNRAFGALQQWHQSLL